MFYPLTFAIALISPAFPLISIEAWLVFVGLVGDHPWPLVALTAATGQTACFCLIYLLGERYVVRLPWIRKKLDRFHPERFRKQAPYFYASGASVGLPPLNLMSIVAPVMQVGLPLFAVIAFTGRLVRISILLVFAQALQEYVPVDVLPDWLRAWAQP